MDSNYVKGFAGQIAFALCAFIAATLAPADAAQDRLQAAACLWPGHHAPKELPGIVQGDLGRITLTNAMLITIKGGSCTLEKVWKLRVDGTPAVFEKSGERYFLFNLSQGNEAKFIAGKVRDMKFE